MKFGKVSGQELDELDFSLPADHPSTTSVLTKAKGNTRIYIGCAKWGRKEWVGLIYPEKTSDKDFLANYVNHFNGIELNGTFYGTKKTNIIKWAEYGVDGFKFCPKFTQLISHKKRLKDAGQITDYYLDAIDQFGAYLGKAFLQLPDNLGPKRFEDLKNYIEYLPKDAPVAVELRHKDWFADSSALEETISLLRENNKGFVITDVGGRRDCLHMALTTPYVFVRFNGYDKHPTDYSRMDEWVVRLKEWMDHGIEEIYFFLHQEDETHTPHTSAYFTQKMNQICGLNLPLPKFISPDT